MMTRRQALKATFLTGAAVAMGSTWTPAQTPAPAAVTAGGPFVLPPLGYAFDALEPFIDARTMEIHHDKHHQAYVTNLNKAVAGREALANKSVEQLLENLDAVPAEIRAAVRNNGGGHFNHSLFWRTLAKGGPRQPQARLASEIDKQFGDFGKFQAEFTRAALGLFGSGWVWLTAEGPKLRIEPLPNQDSPLSLGRIPLLGLDVWEHAYYLKYQNRRAEYAAAFFNIVNWDFVSATAEKHLPE